MKTKGAVAPNKKALEEQFQELEKNMAMLKFKC